MAPSAPKVPSFSFRSNLVILGGRPAYLSNDVGHPASGLAFGHSVCNKESSASSRTSFTTCHQDGQKLAGYVAKWRVIRFQTQLILSLNGDSPIQQFQPLIT